MAKQKLFLITFITVSYFLCHILAREEFANEWAVYMHGGLKAAQQVAREHGFRCIGPVGMLQNVYLFTHRAIPRRQRRSTVFRNMFLERDRRVERVVQQVIKKRVKREVKDKVKDIPFTDEHWKGQWYLFNRDPGMAGHDMNILPAWNKGVTGKNVVITILDDGIDYFHRELQQNYDKNASYDYNDNDPDPRPIVGSKHGTRCAGQVAASANNSFCIVGVAYNAKIGGIRMLDGQITDIVEARSLTHNRDYVDIYSSSWGPDDDGRTVDGPGNLTSQALEEGTIHGRDGKGSIFVWASGNGGTNDDCNCDGYTNSIYTISAAAATSFGEKPWYLEECASTLISSYGGGNSVLDKFIYTSDLNGGCTHRHTGTSVAAPFVAGYTALALEVNPNLTWRDVQHLHVNTANIRYVDQRNVQTNGANKKFSPTFGFGILDGGALVELASKWSAVSEQHICKTAIARPALIIDSLQKLVVDIDTRGCKGTRNFVRYLEHTHLVVNLVHSNRGAVSIYLISPMGTRSRVLSRRKLDSKRGSFKHWAFLSVHFWGENPYGRWKVEIHSAHGTGLLEEWQLVMYGTEFRPGVPYPNVDDQPFVPGQKGVRCHPECLGGCTGPEPYQCISCKNYMLVDGNKTCVAVCPAKYFTDEISLLCVPCHNACWSCIGPQSNQCISCSPGEHLHENKCLQQCPTDHFKVTHEVGFKCKKCHGNCLTCSGTTGNCTTCRHEDVLQGHQCIPRCGHGYFFDGLNCIPCHGSCHTCDGPGYRNCTSCRYRGLHGNNDYLTMYFYKGSCLFTCPLHFYGDHTKGVCEPCGKNCLRCVSEGEQCVACKWGYFLPALDKKDCIKECPRGQFPDLVNGLCILCSSECESCIPGKPFECLSCKKNIFDSRVLKQSTCVQECGMGFFPNKTTNVCQVCPYTCSECKGDKSCKNCHVNLNEDRCLEKCPSGTFRDKERRLTCSRCHSSCKECTGERRYQCLECHRGMVLRRDGSCSAICPPGAFYKDVDAQICKPCHPACVQCFGPSEHECYRCVGNLQLRGTTCVHPCVDNLTENSCSNCHPECNSCFGATKTECLSCHSNKTLYEYHCTDKCPRGFYKVPGKSCMPCHKSCFTCHGELPTQCDSCFNDLGLHQHQCVYNCPKGYFKLDEWCLKCSEKCEECQHVKGFCMRCKKGYVRQDFGCYDSCPEGSFEVPGTRQCERCHRNCKTCFGFNANQCLSCNHGMTLYKSMCFEDCPARYMAEAPTSICNTCPENCITCFSERNASVCDRCRYPYVMHDGSCIKSCPLVGYYTDFYTKSCKKCHETCDICYGPDKDECLVCKKGFSQVGSLCLKQICTQGHYMDAQSFKCQKCHRSCRTCRGPSRRQCAQCNGDYTLRRNTCVLDCNEGQYPDEKTGVCRFCDPICKTCNGPADTNCTSCANENGLVNGKCVLDCADGKYLSEATGVCESCNIRCKTCNGPKYNNCTSCPDGRILIKAQTCVKNCEPGYFAEPFSGKCHLCHHTCKTCNGPTSDNCTRCQKDYVLADGKCIRHCKEGTYYDFSADKCLICKAHCKHCIGPSFDDCTSCGKSFTLMKGQCLLNCADGSYLDMKLRKCVRCADQCKTCNGPSQSNCTSCHKDHALVDGKCILNCPEGKYADELHGKCRFCEAICKTCDGPLSTDCTSCKSSYTHIEGKCVLFCNKGYYPDEEIGKCLPCMNSCESCTGKTSKDCTRCKPGFIMKKGECHRGCNEDCFYNEVSGNCEKCVNPCTSCYGPNIDECLSCRANYNLIENTCFPVCKGAEYLEEKSWNCKNCDSSCESCFGPSRDNCTLCKPGFTLIESTCHMICKPGKYRDYSSGKCLNCSEGCLACQGPRVADCVVCNKGLNFNEVFACVEINCAKGTFYDEEVWQCRSCSDSCDSCDGPSSADCLSCHEGYNLVNKTCVNQCNEQQYYDAESKMCQACNRVCKTCYGPSKNNCTSCFKDFMLIESTCKDVCVIGSYLNEVKQECDLCDDNCLTCFGPTKNDCTSCPPEYILKNHMCVADCADESYYDFEQRKCLPCSSGCLSCNGPTRKNCTGCFGSMVLQNGTCVELCKEGSYRNVELDYCISCDPSCKSCNGPEASDCTSCSVSKFLLQGSCVSKCKTGSFFEEKTKTCVKCHSTCSECSGPRDNQCTYCGENYLLTNNACKLWCLSGSYPDMTQLKCVGCDSTCKECTGPTANNCTYCQSGFNLNEGKCERTCEKGLYWNVEGNRCDRCYERCEMCNGPGADNCQSCAAGFIFDKRKCVPFCLDSYADSEGNCQACHDVCFGCHGPGPANCTSCKNGGVAQKGEFCKCKDGSFLNSANLECQSCDGTCKTCSGPGPQDCITCANELYFDYSKNACSYICSRGTYVFEGACYTCHKTCYSCDGKEANDCLLCDDDLVLFNDTCIDKCPDRFYQFSFNNKSICMICSKNCKTCFGEGNDHCTSCLDGHVLQDGSCRKNCSTPYILDVTQKECIVPHGKPMFRKLLAFTDEASPRRLYSNFLFLVSKDIFLVCCVSFLILICAFILKNR